MTNKSVSLSVYTGKKVKKKKDNKIMFNVYGQIVIKSHSFLEYQKNR